VQRRHKEIELADLAVGVAVKALAAAQTKRELASTLLARDMGYHELACQEHQQVCAGKPPSMEVDDAGPAKEELEEAEALLGGEADDAKFAETVAALKRKQAALEHVQQKRQVLRHGGANFADAALSAAAAAAAFGDPELVQQHVALQNKIDAKRAVDASVASARGGVASASAATPCG
jgi:hypothetical protein